MHAMNENYSRRKFLETTGKGMAALSLSPVLASGLNAPVSKKPNLVFIFSDQQSRDMLGCYGNQDIKTPNLDQFAGEGIRFEQCVSSQPVCTPFRGMLLTGQHPLSNGAYTNDVPLLANNGKYFGHVLSEAGYRTGYIGKWHLLGGNRDRPVPPGKMRYGFDGTFLTNNCHVDFRPGKCFFWNDRQEKEYFSEWEVFGQTRQALNFLDECRNDESFALFVSWHPPHDWGIHADTLIYRYDTIPELMELYDPQKIHLRPSVKDTPGVREAYRGYYATCSGVDKAFGWLMEKLKQKGFEDNTLVVFTSDHGDNLNSYEYKIPKNHPEDTSTRIPFLIRWPGSLRARQVSNLLLNPMDMMPTILGLMGLEVPETVQGRCLSGDIVHRRDGTAESVPLFFFSPSWRGVYTCEFTYGNGVVEHFTADASGNLSLKQVPLKVLYDRTNDPYQLDNLYGTPEAASLQRKMERLTLKWMEHYGDQGATPAEIAMAYGYPDGHFPEDTQEKGFRGRPVDVLREKLKTKS
jgi:arylsulfatase A-like enzyme